MQNHDIYMSNICIDIEDCINPARVEVLSTFAMVGGGGEMIPV